MIVAMVAVRMMQVTVHEIVDVVAVRDPRMAAARARQSGVAVSLGSRIE